MEVWINGLMDESESLFLRPDVCAGKRTMNTDQHEPVMTQIDPINLSETCTLPQFNQLSFSGHGVWQLSAC